MGIKNVNEYDGQGKRTFSSPKMSAPTKNTILTLMTEALNNPNVLAKLQQENKTFNLSPLIENLLLRLKMRDPEIFRNIRPEESQGFASVAELRAAEANVQAIRAGQPQLPSPPQEGQDHETRIGVYRSASQIVEDQILIQQLQELVFIQQQLLGAESQKKSPRTNSQVNLPSPSVERIGA